jgi:hypothetical protein
MLLSKVLPLVAVFASGAWAQFDMAQCASGFDWNKNSLGQDPCTVGSTLDASCRGLAQYTYPPLNASQYYLPPQTNHTGDLTCDCNTVMYSLYMACASCQGGTIYSWTQWTQQCTSGVYISSYPVDIAQGTAVPYWAYYNVTTLPTETWNQTVAISVGDTPEAKPQAITTVSSGHSSSSGHSTLTKTSTGDLGPTNNSNTKSGPNVAAIVGGVVGSVVPLTILAVVVFLFARHRRQNAQQQPQMMPMPVPEDDPYKRPMSYGPPPVNNFTPYNPSDPSTFPPQSPPSSVTYTTQPNNLRGAYSGMPEV